MATDLFQAPDYYNMDDLLNEEAFCVGVGVMEL